MEFLVYRRVFAMCFILNIVRGVKNIIYNAIGFKDLRKKAKDKG